MKTTGNKILITGGGSGIGLGLAKKFLQLGNEVIICGRREEVLNEVKLQFSKIITKVCDVEDENERENLYKWVLENHSDLNVLINNAGIQNWMNIDDENFYQKAQKEVQINILGPLHLTNLFLQLPKINTIMNVTSGLAFVPFSKVPVYCGTKAFLRSFTLSLRHLLKPKNVEVVEIIPPALDTDLGGKGIHTGAPKVEDFIESIFAQLEEGKDEVAFASSLDRLQDNNSAIKTYFDKINPSN